MIKIVAHKDLGRKETFERWNGKFLDETAYDKVLHVTEDIGIMKPIHMPYQSSCLLMPFCSRGVMARSLIVHGGICQVPEPKKKTDAWLWLKFLAS